MLILGLCAAALTILSFVMQAVKIVRTRDTSSLSTPMWVLSTTAFAVWIGYGIGLGELPIIIPNAVCFVLALVILILKILPRHRRDRVLDKVAG